MAAEGGRGRTKAWAIVAVATTRKTRNFILFVSGYIDESSRGKNEDINMRIGKLWIAESEAPFPSPHQSAPSHKTQKNTASVILRDHIDHRAWTDVRVRRLEFTTCQRFQASNWLSRRTS